MGDIQQKAGSASGGAHSPHGGAAARAPRRLLRQATRLAKDVERITRRKGDRLPPAIASRLQIETGHLKGAIANRDHDRIVEHGTTLQSLADQHLSKYRKPVWREYAESIIVAVLVALFLRAFVVEAFKIPSGSMIPTLKVGDHIFVNKFSYGLRMPMTRWYFARFSQPSRGDLIVFMYPKEPDKDFIKRVVGVPGDTVTVRNGMLQVVDQEGGMVNVDNRILRTDYIYREGNHEFERPVISNKYEEALQGRRYNIIHRRDGLTLPDFGPQEVLPGHLFVLGDNRDNSHDSRVWGQVPMENVKGRAFIIWWSSSDFRRMGTILR